MDLLKQVTGGYNNEQLENLWKKAKQFGVPDEAIQQVQQKIEKK